MIREGHDMNVVYHSMQPQDFTAQWKATYHEAHVLDTKALGAPTLCELPRSIRRLKAQWQCSISVEYIALCPPFAE